jgi:hypothetical protein
LAVTIPAPLRAARSISPLLVPMIPEASTSGVCNSKFKNLQERLGLFITLAAHLKVGYR